jgi:hypothetical protein
VNVLVSRLNVDCNYEVSHIECTIIVVMLNKGSSCGHNEWPVCSFLLDCSGIKVAILLEIND